jgi:hypothetical protein
MRRRVASMKGGTMMALGNTARGSMAGQQRQGAAWQRAARRRQQQQGAHGETTKAMGRHGSKGQDSCHDSSTDGGTRRMAAASLVVNFVGCANGMSGGIKGVGGASPLLPRIGCGHDDCPGIFIAPSSLYGACIFNNGIAFDNRQRNEQDASAQLVQITLSKCWNGMKGRHDSSTEGGTGRRVTSMKALNLNYFLSCRLSPRRPTQCRLVPLSCCPSPCHPSPLSCHPLPSLCPLLRCHPLLYHPPLSCHATVSHVALHLSCAGWLLHCLVSRCSNVSLAPAG